MAGRPAIAEKFATTQETPDPSAFEGLATAALMADEPAQELDYAQKAVDKQPNSGEMQEIYAQACLRAGMKDHVIESLNKSIRLAPQRISAWLTLAELYQSSLKTDKAGEIFRASTQAIPDSALAHLALGEYYLAHNAHTQALFPLGTPSMARHPILGTWSYRHAGRDYTREFTNDGRCILRDGGQIGWIKTYTVVDERTALVEGKYVHTLTEPDTLNIENVYTGKRTGK